MWFYVFSYLLDEISTLTLLKIGGLEVNLFVAWMIGVSPLLWMFGDLLIFLAYYACDYYMMDKVTPGFFKWFWVIAFSTRISCAIWNYIQIIIHI